MKKKKFSFKWLSVVAIAGAFFLQGCEKDKNKADTNPADNTNLPEMFHISKEVAKTKTYISKFADLQQGNIGAGNGFSIDHDSNRLYSSSNGAILYNLKYKKGIIEKYVFASDKEDEYKLEKDLDISAMMGMKHFRWKVINDEVALAYSVVYKHNKDANGNYTNTSVEVHIAKIDLPSLVVGQKVQIPITNMPMIANLPNPYIWRVDNPTIHNSKMYIGMAIKGYDGSKDINTTDYSAGQVVIDCPASTLVLDFPSFQNPKIISSGLPKGIGDTYGYRAPAYFSSEAGDIYHVSMQNTHVFKISNGKYDDTYDFDLAKALGLTTTIGGTGIFYAGNGIAFVPYYDQSVAKKKAEWHVARVDIHKKTAIKMNFPSNLDLSTYQNAKVTKDGKVYFALTPRDGNGNVYIVDPTKEDANAFKKGASLEVAAGVSYVGVY